MGGQTHEDMCLICNTLSAEDIEALEIEARKRQDNYTTIGAKYGVKYNVKISKQRVADHMRWLRDNKITPQREQLLSEEKDKLLDTLEEHSKIHKWLWKKIEFMEGMKKGSTSNQLLKIHNTQDRYIKSILKGLRLLAELRGDADRDARKIDITVALKQLKEEEGVEDE
jgi:hypothetical protein